MFVEREQVWVSPSDAGPNHTRPRTPESAHSFDRQEKGWDLHIHERVAQRFFIGCVHLTDKA